MISFRVLPSDCLLWTYSMVGWSQRIRVVAMRHRALLAWRFAAVMLLWFTNRGVGAGLVCEPVLVSGGEVVVVSDASFEL